MTKLFRVAFLAFLIVMALVIGGSCYQTISIVPFWESDISMFKNYGHWGIDYFPFLSPVMTVLWLVVLVSGFGLKLENQKLLYFGHSLFLLLLVGTFVYFAPFLMRYMGHPENNIPDKVLAARLHTWARWDFAREIVGLIPFSIFIYSYGKMKPAVPNN